MRLGVWLAALALLVGCTADPRPRDAGVSTGPLPTAATPPLVCGMIPASTVETLLGDTPYTRRGDGPIRLPGTGELNLAMCSLSGDDLPGSQADLIVAHVEPGVDANLLREVAAAPPGLRLFPVEVGPGTVARTDFRRGDTTYHRAGARLQWGNYRVDVVVREVSDRRDPVADAMALAQQVAHAMKLPRSAPTASPAR